jgi:hypothetical protein
LLTSLNRCLPHRPAPAFMCDALLHGGSLSSAAISRELPPFRNAFVRYTAKQHRIAPYPGILAFDSLPLLNQTHAPPSGSETIHIIGHSRTFIYFSSGTPTAQINLNIFTTLSSGIPTEHSWCSWQNTDYTCAGGSPSRSYQGSEQRRAVEHHERQRR